MTLLIAEAQLLVEFKRDTEAFDLLDKALASQPEEPDLLYETSLIAERLNRFDVLERNLRKLILLKPEDPRAYNALGYSLADRSLRLDEAQQLIDKALSLAPNDAYIIDSKGWLLYRRGETAAATETLQKAFDLRSDPEIAAHLGEVLWVSGNHDEARKTWKDAAKTSPSNQVLTDTIRKFKP
ncbi:MAG TPA: tetratricopeptide repeat protein [Rhodocyclaceae bacterium]|nr:tetratricopeptide repeat protein [Rhodocyclaceae bacterium]